MDTLNLGLAELARRLRAKEMKAVDLADQALRRIAATEALNSFIHVDRDRAMAQAEASDARLSKAEPRSLLEGIPIGLKDNFVTSDMPTTAASRILDGFISPYEGGATKRLRDAGAVIVGKTNMDEFAMGSSSEHSAFGPVKNPWDESKVPGGSSGGSAVAVATRQVVAAFGTDTGGSIRQPAALCGVLGLKPTYGRVSRYGVIAFASSLDQVGPFATRVEDLAVLLHTVAGQCDHDSTSSSEPVPDYSALAKAPIDGIRVGVPREYFAEGIDPEVEAAVREGIRVLEEKGATIHEVSLPHTAYGLSAYYLIATAEASSNLARYDGVRYGRRAEDNDLVRMIVRSRAEGFGAEVQRRIILGTFVLSAGYYDAYYGKAQRVRTLIRRDFEQAFEKVDVIATPTSPIQAFDLRSKLSDPLSMYLSDVCTLGVNLAGVPALSMPCGRTSANLPVGLQLIGRWFDEGRILACAARLEESGEQFQSAAAPTRG